MNESIIHQGRKVGRIRQHRVEYGTIGLGNKLGYESGISLPPENFQGDWSSISAHANSVIEVEFDVPVEICGCLDASSTYHDDHERLYFYVDGMAMDAIVGTWDVTRSVVLESGGHQLEIKSNSSVNGCHSLWLYRTINREPATSENTVFLSAAAFGNNFDEKTRILRKSADRFGVPMTFVDERENFVNLYHHKVSRMREELEKHSRNGMKYAFLFDSRDLFFIHPIRWVLAKFNALHQGNVIFNVDTMGALCPYHAGWFLRELQSAKRHYFGNINSGFLAGRIDQILSMIDLMETLREEMLEGRPRGGVLYRIYHDAGTRHINDDQFFFQVCLCYEPDRFDLDTKKELCAFVDVIPDTPCLCDDPRRKDVFCKASVIHASKPSWNPDWEVWAERLMEESHKFEFERG